MLTRFEDFSLQVFDDTYLLHLVSDSKRLLILKELTLTLTLRLSLGLGLAWDHYHDKTFFILSIFEDCSFQVFEDTYLLHLVSDSQRLSFSQEFTPTLTLGLSIGLGLGLIFGKTISIENLKPNAKDEYDRRGPEKYL